MITSHASPPAMGWVLRLSWLALPALMGPALGDALRDWSAAPRTAAEVMAWAAWGIGLSATLAPRPLGLTAVRILAGGAGATALTIVPATTALEGAGAVTGAVLAAALAGSTLVAEWMANGSAYGDERRFPLRNPWALGYVMGPIAAVAVTAGVAVGPLLIADGRVVVGSASLAGGLAVAAFLARSMHALSRRWLIFVPGGLVVHDPLTLAHPVLLLRSSVTAIGVLSDHGTQGAFDLRLGAPHGVRAALTPPVPMAIRGGRLRSAEVVEVDVVLVSPTRPGVILALASERGLPVS